MLGNKLINTNAGGGCTNTVDLYNPFPDGGGLALYQLNGDATDVSGNYDGTATNVTYGAGQFGQAGVFNGSSSEINLNSAVLPASVFSVSMWFNLNTINRTNYLITQYILAGGSNGRFEFAVDSTNNFVIYLEGGALTFTTSVSLSANTWYNVVLIKNGASGWSCYLDGQSLGTNSDTRNIYTGDNTRLGKRVGLSSGILDGSLDQVRIFNRALRPYEVEALYTEEYCTPTIVPSEHFNTVLYTGNGGGESITSVGFQPDLTWIKGRETSGKWNVLYDSIRGTNKMLSSNETSAELTYGSVTPTANGFDLGSLAGDLNSSGEDYVAWNFKAGGAAVTNTDGTITSQVSANTEAGFSVVTYGGPTGEFSVGHGLGVKPTIVITKGMLAAGDWTVYFTLLDGSLDFMRLNQTSAKEDSSRTMWTDEVFYTTTEDSVAYCFAEVEGFSSFGSYVGTDAPNNNILTGFEPAMVIIKSTGATNGDWNIFDNKRNPANPLTDVLKANTSGTETTEPALNISFLENGFSLNGATAAGGRGQINQSGITYIYMAFAADPTAVEPSLADSFNTVLYTSTGGSQSITGVGFQPDLLWTKNRTSTWFHQIVDSVRLAPNTIYSNSTQAESTPVSYTSSLDTDGFTVNYTETIGSNYVAWAWKGAELPAINSNGSIPSVVSANPAAGFSIVSWTSTGSNTSSKTVGHGLEDTPNVVILKNRSATNTSWRVYHSGIPSPNNSLALNGTEAAFSFFPSVSSTNFGLANSITTGESSGTSGQNIIAYCFAEVAGFSKFGSYTGNGLTGASGPSITTGFEPAFLLVKQTNGTGAWFIMDNKRSPTNPRQLLLQPASNAAEENVGNAIDFNSNGFQILDTNASRNASGGTYIYMAFANQF